MLIPGNLDERIREKWRALALRSTYFMAQVLGFEDLTPELHLEMARWIEGPSKRKLGLVPRGHLKTSIWTLADTLRLVSGNPLERVLIKNEVAQNAYNWLHLIGSATLHNQLWRWLFPERCPRSEARWREDAIELPREVDFPEATIEAIGVGGASTSKHFTRIKEDDAIGKKAADSRSVMADAIVDHQLCEHLLSEPKTGGIDTYGTHWAYGPSELYNWMRLNEPDLDPFIRSCYRQDGSPLWPERFPPEEIERLRKKDGAYLFACQMLNNPIAPGATELSLDALRYYTLIEIPTPDGGSEAAVKLEDPNSDVLISLRDLAVWQVIDPGLSPESTSARSASLTVGLTGREPFDIVILSALAKKLSPKALVDMAWEEWERWNPICAAIEVVAAQIAFFYWIPTVYPLIGLKKLKTDFSKNAKFRRIRSSGHWADEGRLYVHRSMTDFLEEWASFPNGETVDLLDCLGYAPQVWAPPPELRATAQGEKWEEEEGHQATRALSGRSPITGY